MSFADRIRRFFRRSSRVHLDHAVVSSVSDMVKLIDRFLDDQLDYALEWDDFVSWDNDNPSVESYRQEIADLEIGFFSKDFDERRKAERKLIEIRNKAAFLTGGIQRKFR